MTTVMYWRSEVPRQRHLETFLDLYADIAREGYLALSGRTATPAVRPHNRAVMEPVLAPPPPVRNRLASELFLVLATIIWGGTFAVTRAGLAHVSPLLLIAIRFLGAAAIVGPILAWKGRRWWRGAGRGLLLGLAVCAGYTMQTGGLAFTTAARSAFLTYLFAVFVPPLARIFSRRRLRPANVVGLGIVIVGATVMTRPWAAADWNVGDLITVGSAIAFAFFIVLVDRFSAGHNPIDFVPTQFLVAGVLSLIAALLFEPLRFEPGPALWFALGYLTLLGTVGALGLQTVFQAGTTPVRATTIYALEPVFAAATGVVFLSEHLAALEITGAAIILTGVLFSELAGLALAPASILVTLKDRRSYASTQSRSNVEGRSEGR